MILIMKKEFQIWKEKGCNFVLKRLKNPNQIESIYIIFKEEVIYMLSIF